MMYSYFLKLEEQYVSEKDWEVKENANETKSFGNFVGYYIDKTWKDPEIMSRIFGEEATKAHFNGDIHIHKMPFSYYIPYCTGWSYKKILQMGLQTPTIISKPAKHIDTAIAHLVNFFYIAAQEWTGAQATSAFDLYIAPFVKKDELKFENIKQWMQHLYFDINYPSRLGYQAPFTNITLVLDTVKNYLEEDAIVGGKKVGVLGDYVDEAINVVKALSEIQLEGDARGQPFTFPIPTLFLTKEFDWNNTKWDGLTDLIFEVLARRGTFYLLNGYSTNVEVLMAMCCRLNLDIVKSYQFSLKKRELEDLREEIRKAEGPKGIWAIPDATGSIGIVTINLPRIAFLARYDKDKFFDLLLERLKLARSILQIMRSRYERSLRLGLMPLTKRYLGHFYGHYNTFGLVGLPEAAANLINPNLWNNGNKSEIEEAVKLMKEIVRFVREYSEECENEEEVLYNVEEVPAESTAYRLASLDYKTYKDSVELGEFFIPFYDGIPFYSNSIIPYYYDIPIYSRAKYEGEVQQEFTGGVMMHLFLYESPDPKALGKMIEKIAKNTKVVYFSITPTIAVCLKCGWSSVGLFDKCPKCNGPVDLWSRIVGYYRPIRNWNIGKKAEFMRRIQYGSEGNSIVTGSKIKVL